MEKLVVLFSGHMRSGKDTAAQMLKDALGPKVELMAFAQHLKEMCREAFGPLVTYLNGNYLKGSDRIGGDSWFERKTPITRLLLQAVGTDIVRRINPDYWVSYIHQQIHLSSADIVVLTDWRFPQEMQQLAQHWPCVTVRVDRELHTRQSGDRHSSETALDDWPRFDYVIDNDKDLVHLRLQVSKLADWLVNEHMD